MLAPGLLIDNDVFILLAGANLLETSIRVLGFEPEQARYNGTLRYVIRGRRFRHLSSLVEQVLSACDRIPTLHEAPDAALLQQLAEQPNVDEGEAILYGLVAEHPLYYLTSNDKKAMRNIATEPRLTNIREAVAGKVICMERLLLKLLDIYDPPTLGSALESVAGMDTVVRMVFTPNNMRRPGECVSALNAYYQNLEREVGMDFLWPG